MVFQKFRKQKSTDTAGDVSTVKSLDAGSDTRIKEQMSPEVTVASYAGTETAPKRPWYKRIKLNNVFSVNEERPTPKEVYNWRIYFTAALASSAAVLIGYDSGYIGGMTQNPSFLEAFGLDINTTKGTDVIADVISCFHIAAFGGALLTYPLSYYWGYRVAMQVMSFVGVVGSAIMLAAVTGSLAPLYVGRVLSGICVGSATNVVVVYLSEVSPPSIRGQIVALFELAWRIGDLTSYWLNYGVSKHQPEGQIQWLIPVAIQLIPAAIFFIGSFILKESPRWLCQKDREEEALRNLTWMRKLPADSEYIDWEFTLMKESIRYQNLTVGGGFLDPAREIFVRNKYYIKRLGITFGLFLFQNFMGIQALNYYSVTIFKSLGVKGTNASLFSSGFFGVAKFACTLIYIFFIVDGFGRRVAFLTSSSFCSIFFWYIGAYLKIKDPTKPGVDPGPGGRAAIGFMYMWTCSFILAWSGGPFVWSAEVYAQSIRNFTQSLNAAISWIPIFIMTRCTTDMIKAMNYGIFFFFAAIAFLSVPFVFFLVPETKGIPLESIDRLFDKGVPAYKAHRIVVAQLKQENATKQMRKPNVWDDDKKDQEDEFIEDIRWPAV